jgi:hypothetical protein
MAKRLIPVNKQNAYLTKRVLVRATRKNSNTLTIDAMRVKGYVVKAEGNWIVKIYNSGVREQLSPIDKTAWSNTRIVLD